MQVKVYTAAVQMRYVLYLGALSHSMMVIKLIQATFALAVESLPPFSTPPTSSVSYLSLYFSFFDEQERTTLLQPCLKLCSCWERLPWPGEQGHAYLGSPVSL